MVGVRYIDLSSLLSLLLNLIYSGPSLLEHLDELPMVDRKVKAPVMIPISEKYKDMGTIAVGKLESGHIRKGDTLLLMPNKDEIEIAAMYNEMEEEVQIALSGDNVRIRMRGVEDDDISPGFVLTSVHKPVHAVRQFEAQLAILDHKNIICPGYSAVLHVHTLAEEVTLSVRWSTMSGQSWRDLFILTWTSGNRRCYTTLTRRLVASLENHLSLLRKTSGSLRCSRRMRQFV
jgi:translation elongation factor EF-1alpha